jgi:hypothetical protein
VLCGPSSQLRSAALKIEKKIFNFIRSASAVKTENEFDLLIQDLENQLRLNSF